MAGAIALLVGCAPILLDQVVPPWGIPAAVLAIWLILKKQGQSLAVVGVVKPPNGWSSTLLMGVGGALLIVALGEFGYPLLRELTGLPEQDISSYEGIEGNNSLLAIYLTVSWTTAGFGEELIFRGFLLAGLARCLGMSRAAWVAAVIVSSILFGLIHIRTGIGGVLETGMIGAVLGGLYLLSRRSIWAAYIAHGLANTVVFLFIYSGLYKSLP
ncbi:MAG: CPBP family intramembrane metalloprotease [bacterium]|nr:CPBP family intramembrane metalloprotease [bacterium]